MYPNTIAVDSRDNVYISSYGAEPRDSHKILKLSHDDSGEMQVSDFAGQDDSGFKEGSGTAAMFASPTNIVCHKDTLYVVDSWNQRIRKITLDGTVSTFVEGYGYRFDSITCFAVDPNGNLFVGDKNGRIIRKIEPNGDDTTFARTTQMLDDIAVDKDGNVYGSLYKHPCIYKITFQGQATIFAGSKTEKGYKDGAGIEARFKQPRGLAIDRDGNILVADMLDNRIRKITPAGVVTTVAVESQDSLGRPVKLEFPMYLAIHDDGTLYVSQGQDGDIEIIAIFSTGEIELLFSSDRIQDDEDEDEDEEFPPVDRSGFGVPDEPRPPSQTPSRRPSISEDPQGGRKKTRKVKKSKRTTFRKKRTQIRKSKKSRKQ
jgi:sugar lactone lactonase YvrE